MCVHNLRYVLFLYTKHNDPTKDRSILHHNGATTANGRWLINQRRKFINFEVIKYYMIYGGSLLGSFGEWKSSSFDAIFYPSRSKLVHHESTQINKQSHISNVGDGEGFIQPEGDIMTSDTQSTFATLKSNERNIHGGYFIHTLPKAKI